MTIDIKCPNCNFSKKVAREKIPAGLKYARCPRCRSTFELPSITDPDTTRQEDENNGFVNNNRVLTPAVSEDTGYFAGLLKTLKGVLFTPAKFFNSVKGEDRIWEPIAFGILIGSIGFMFDIFWAFLLSAEEVSDILEKLYPYSNTEYLFIGYICLSPPLVLMFMFFSTIVIHFCLFILRGAHRGFVETLKVSAYSTSTLIFCLIPYIGEYIALIWWIITVVTGLREIHEISTLRASFSLILPLFLFLMLAVVSVFFISCLII